MLVISRARLGAHLRMVTGLAMAGVAGKLLGDLVTRLGERLSVFGPFMEMTWLEGLLRWLAGFARQLERFMRGGGG